MRTWKEYLEEKGAADLLDESKKKKKKWIQDVEIKRPGICTGDKFGGPSCPEGSKQHSLAKTFRKIAKHKKKGK